MSRSTLRADCPAMLGLVAPSRNSLRSLRSLHSNKRDESDHEARWRARPRALRFSAAHRRRSGRPPAALPESTSECLTNERHYAVERTNACTQLRRRATASEVPVAAAEYMRRVSNEIST
jgi:hypothetical protein